MKLASRHLELADPTWTGVKETQADKREGGAVKCGGGGGGKETAGEDGVRGGGGWEEWWH